MNRESNREKYPQLAKYIDELRLLFGNIRVSEIIDQSTHPTSDIENDNCMDKKVYVIKNKVTQTYAEDAVREIDYRLDRKMVVTIQPYKKNRSNDQNNLYWSWMRVLAKESGSDPLSMHEAMKQKFLEPSEAVLPDGELIKVTGSSRKLKTGEFSEYLQQIQAWATEFGIFLPTLDEVKH